MKSCAILIIILTMQIKVNRLTQPKSDITPNYQGRWKTAHLLHPGKAFWGKHLIVFVNILHVHTIDLTNLMLRNH